MLSADHATLTLASTTGTSASPFQITDSLLSLHGNWPLAQFLRIPAATISIEVSSKSDLSTAFLDLGGGTVDLSARTLTLTEAGIANGTVTGDPSTLVGGTLMLFKNVTLGIPVVGNYPRAFAITGTLTLASTTVTLLHNNSTNATHPNIMRFDPATPQAVMGTGTIAFDGLYLDQLVGNNLTLGAGITTRTGDTNGSVSATTLTLDGAIVSQTPGKDISVLSWIANIRGLMKATNGASIHISTRDNFTSSRTLTADGGLISFLPALPTPSVLGSHAIAGTIQAKNGGSIVFLHGTISLLSPVTLDNGNIRFASSRPQSATTISGSGTVTVTSTLTADALNTSSLLLDGTLLLRAHGTSSAPTSLSNLALAADTNNTFTAQLDIADNPLIHSPAAADKSAALATLQSALSQGTTGTHGITSLTTAADPTHKTTVVIDNALLHLTTFFNTPVDDTSLLLLSTWLGDANLDRKVNVTDLGTLATYYGQPTAAFGPLHGDFNNDGTVNVTDLGLLATNYGAGTNNQPFALDAPQLPLTNYPLQTTPEPTTLALLLPALLLTRRPKPQKTHTSTSHPRNPSPTQSPAPNCPKHQYNPSHPK